MNQHCARLQSAFWELEQQAQLSGKNTEEQELDTNNMASIYA